MSQTESIDHKNPPASLEDLRSQADLLEETATHLREKAGELNDMAQKVMTDRHNLIVENDEFMRRAGPAPVR